MHSVKVTRECTFEDKRWGQLKDKYREMDKFWLVLLEMNLKSTFYMSRGLDLLIKPGRLLKFLSEFILTIVDCHK